MSLLNESSTQFDELRTGNGDFKLTPPLVWLKV